MSVIQQGYQFRNLMFGTLVPAKALTPPNSGSTSTLFTVAGGNVLITLLVGQVTTVMSGTTGTIALGMAPTTGTANTGGIAAAAVIGGAEVGTWVGPVASSGLAGTLVVGSSKQAGATVFTTTPFVAAVGTITITTAVATMTGQLTWYCSYVPLDNAGSVS
jgi:hypothetical protein